jgi:hypothetical protein
MPEFVIHKENGKFLNIKKMEEYTRSLPDGSYKVVIELYSKRTLPQNAWLHSILPEVKHALRDAGFDQIKTEEDAKDVIKALFFSKEMSNGVETIKVVEGTSKQSKINFAEKAEEIIRWASEYLNIDVAPPEKQLEIKI